MEPVKSFKTKLFVVLTAFMLIIAFSFTTVQAEETDATLVRNPLTGETETSDSLQSATGAEDIVISDASVQGYVSEGEFSNNPDADGSDLQEGQELLSHQNQEYQSSTNTPVVEVVSATDGSVTPLGSISEALDLAEEQKEGFDSGDTIRLVSDITNQGSFNLVRNGVDLDLNGHSITMGNDKFIKITYGAHTIYNSDAENSSAITGNVHKNTDGAANGVIILGGNNIQFAVKDRVTIENTCSDGLGIKVLSHDGTSDNPIINRLTLTISGATVKGDAYGIQCQTKNGNRATVNIRGAAISGKQAAIYNTASSDNFEIISGIFSSKIAKEMITNKKDICVDNLDPDTRTEYPYAIYDPNLEIQLKGTLPYTGTAQEPDVTVKYNDSTLDPGSYHVKYMNNIEVGTATVLVGGNGILGYKNFTISPAPITDNDVELADLEHVYDGTAKKPRVVVTINGLILTQEVDYSVSYEDHIDAGTGTAIVTGKGNYTGEVRKNFEIKPADVANASILLEDVPHLYDGAPHTPEVTVIYDGIALDDEDYEVEYQDHTDAGQATVIVTGTGNYKGENYASFVIETHKVPVPTGQTLTYTGQPQSGVAPSEYYTIIQDPAVNVGTYTATLQLKDRKNYEWADETTDDKTVTWEITPAVLTVQTESAEKKYDGKPLTASGSIKGLVNDETVQFTVTGSQTKSGKSVNTYELKWNGTAKESNYLVVENLGTLTVNSPTSPKTGDSNSPWFWASFMFGSGAILAAMLIIRKKKKS